MVRGFVCLLLCLGLAAGDDPVPPSATGDYWETEVLGNYCYCELKGGFGDLDPVRVKTFDVDDVVDSGSIDLLAITRQQKTLVSRWTKKPGTAYDPCEYQLRVVTQKEASWDGSIGNLYIEWMGFGFDDHKRRLLERNVMGGQDIEYVAKRGRGFEDGPRLHKMPFEYKNLTSNVDLHVSMSHDGEFIKFRSKSCQFAVNFFPKERDTRLEFFVGQHYKNEGDGVFEGICGNCNDVISDDKEKCFEVNNQPRDVFESTTWDGQKGEISDSCKEGKHQGHGYLGGNRLRKVKKD